MSYRTHTCNDLRAKDADQKVTLSGWIHSIRSHGTLVFIDLRDRYGITQIKVDSDKIPQIKDLKKESVIKVTGKVEKKPEPNKNLKTGEIELNVTNLEVLSSAESLPMDMDDSVNTAEDTRLKYRYLDIRRDPIKSNLIKRHKITNAFRDYLSSQNFVEVETPILAKSTPEGARDFIVPSRVHNGKFFALPQSPQIFKQILMVSGMDRYFQLARCFRDEDLRADRQLEFTQVDIEMSFIERDDILTLNENMMKHIMKEIIGVDIRTPFRRIPYDEAMTKYGSDKPDLRVTIEMHDLTELLNQADFKIFQEAEYITGFYAAAEFSRKAIDKYTDFVKEHKADGLIALRLQEEELQGPVAKFLSDGMQQKLVNAVEMEDGDTLFIIAGKDKEKAQKALGQLRLKIGKELNLMTDEKYVFSWTIDFPMFEWSEEFNRIMAMHHPFTMPNPEDIEKMENAKDDKDLLSVRSNAYDLVLNGNEVAGGSIRIHDQKLQKLIFKTLGIEEERAMEKFGFLMNSFRYGVPPHGGIAYGFDRFAMILCGAESIRDVIAFPRNKQTINPMDESPNVVDQEQLDELGIDIKK